MLSILLFRRKLLVLLILLLLAGLFVLPEGYSKTPVKVRQDTLNFKAFRGLVIDAQTKSPVVFASVYLEGTNIGTITNSEGKFLIKAPVPFGDTKIGISCLSYKSKIVSTSNWGKGVKSITLTSDIIPVKEVVIREMDPRALVESALMNIPGNYPDSAAMLTGFYRESIRKNNTYLSVGEAVLDIYKGSYKKQMDVDREKILKGRKSQFAKRKDTLMVKFMGGPTLVSYLDLAKNPGDIMGRTMLDYYDFTLNGFLQIDGRETYVIGFDQKDSVSISLYKGVVYLDVENLAIVEISFAISPKQFDQAIQYLIKKKPMGMKINLLHANYLVKYRKLGQKWVLNYVRLETGFHCKWDKKLFRSNYFITSESAITDIDYTNVIKPKYRENIKSKDIFFEKVSYFEDPDFWGANNVIEPEESIQSAIKKISRKLKRHR